MLVWLATLKTTSLWSRDYLLGDEEMRRVKRSTMRCPRMHRMHGKLVCEDPNFHCCQNRWDTMAAATTTTTLLTGTTPCYCASRNGHSLTNKAEICDYICLLLCSPPYFDKPACAIERGTTETLTAYSCKQVTGWLMQTNPMLSVHYSYGYGQAETPPLKREVSYHHVGR
jgi:hypothetical protein